MAGVIKPVLPRPTGDTVKVTKVSMPGNGSANFASANLINEINEVGKRNLEAITQKAALIILDLQERIPQDYVELITNINQLSRRVDTITNDYYNEDDLMSFEDLTSMLDSVFGAS